MNQLVRQPGTTRLDFEIGFANLLVVLIAWGGVVAFGGFVLHAFKVMEVGGATALLATLAYVCWVITQLYLEHRRERKGEKPTRSGFLRRAFAH